MKFIKVLSSGKITTDFGYLKIADGNIDILIKAENKVIDEVGIVDGGIGVVLKDTEKKNKTPYVQSSRKFEEDDIPVNLQATGYKFRINAEKISDTEFVFKFDKAFMVKR